MEKSSSSLLRPLPTRRIRSSMAHSNFFLKGGTYKAECKPLFQIWKRSFTPEVLALLEGKNEDDRNNIEWSGDMFNANLFPLRISMSQLRSSFLTNKQTQILAALVPNEIIYTKNPAINELQTFVGVLMFADVSGFTALCEKYNNTGKGGTYRLTATLNGYIGAMVEVIYCHGGDVLKFSGDAFLAQWKVKKGEVMAHTIHRVISCATYIQHTLGSFETDVKVFLKVKLAISAGNLYFSLVGTDQGRHYICVGTPVDDVKAAEHTCVSGDIVLSPSAWGHCSPFNYEHSYKDQYHVKVTQILYDPSARKRQIVGASRLPPISVNINLHGTGTRTETDDKEDERVKDEEPEQVDYTKEGCGLPTKIDFKRAQLREAAKKKMGSVLRQFLIPPVVQQVDADQPLEYLTEMRQVTIMFINIIPVKMGPIQLTEMADAAYTIISALVRSSMGCVNKMCLFDKDCMLLVIFGLRGFKTELEGQNALKCGYRVRVQVSEIKGVDCVSVGVTTGMTYCGVVGHPLRKEYTVIGGVVNKAARIMCAFPGKVTTDQITNQLSKLPANCFIPQGAVELKGLGTVLNIYEYTEDASHLGAQALTKCTTPPILGREVEMEIISKTFLEGNRKPNQQKGVLITGAASTGKSRLLEEVKIEAKKRGYRLIPISLDHYHSRTAFSLAYIMIKQVLNLADNCSVRDREEQLLSVLGRVVASEKLCYLNDVMQVKLPHSMAYITDDTDERKLIAQQLLQRLIDQSEKPIIICIDNVQNVDLESREMLVGLLDHNTTLIVMALQTSEQPNKVAQELTRHKNVKQFKLFGLAPEYLAPLACQFLDVRAIPVELDDLLQSRSGGNPGWCENYLMSLLHSGGIVKTDVVISEVPESLVMPEENLISNIIRTEVDTGFNKEDGKEEEGEEEVGPEMVPICVVPPGQDLLGTLLPQNLDAIIMTAFDSLPPYEQLLLKCGSVLGLSFTRQMINAVMHNPIPKQTAIAVQRVFEMRILCCGTYENNPHHRAFVVPRAMTNYPSNTVQCYCNVKPEGFLGSDTLPKYAFCQLMFFKIPTFRDVTYELLPGNQKKEFHARAAAFLEGQAHKCDACGGGDFVTVPSVLISEIESQESLVNEGSVISVHSSNSEAEFRAKLDSIAQQSSKSIVKPDGGIKWNSIEPDEDNTTTPEVVSRRGSTAPSMGSKRNSSIGGELPKRRVTISTETKRSSGSQNGSKKSNAESQNDESETSRSLVAFGRLSAQTVIGQNKVVPITGDANDSQGAETRNKAIDIKLVTGCLGLHNPLAASTVQKYSTFSMGKSFSHVDFRNCECPLILAGVYEQLIEHCTAAGLQEKQIRFTIEYGAANILMGNNVQAINILDKAMELCSVGSSDEEKVADRATIKLDLGKIHTLLGQAHLDLGVLPLARKHLLLAMRYFGQPFWTMPFVAGLQVQFHKSRQKLHQMFPNALMGHGHGKTAVINDEASACLAHLNNLFMMEKDWQLAKLAAFKSLNLAQQSPNNMAEICTAYSNLMDVCHHFGELEYCRQLEEVALKHKYNVSEAKDLIALGRLYCALFSSRGLRGEITSAIAIGFRVMQISTRVNTDNVKLYILPLLITATTMAGQFKETVDLFSELESLAREDADMSAQAWYHALCLDMILVTGYTLRPAALSLGFARQLIDDPDGHVIVRDPDSESRLVVCVWLWYTCTQDWPEASKWEKIAMRYYDSRMEYTFSSLITMTKLVQGMLIHLSVKLGKSRPRDLEPWRNKTHLFLKRIKKLSQGLLVIQPRYYHMKAYYWHIYQHKTRAAKCILKANELSILHGNKMEEAWTKHSEAHWSGRLNNIDRYFWKEHNHVDFGVDWHEFDNHSWTSVMYTLETPFNNKIK